MSQKNCVLDARIPSGSGKCEFGLPASFRDWRELEEVARDNKLNPSKRTTIVSYASSYLFKLIEEVSVDH